MDKPVVGKLYYVSDPSIKGAEFGIVDGICTHRKSVEKEAKMGKCSVSDVELSDFLENLERNYPPKWYIRVIAQDLQDARKELEEAKKYSVWRDAPEDATFASVHHCVTSEQPYKPDVAHFYHREVPKTPKQELIDKFTEKNALAMKCANLSKEILEAFAKEYEEVMKPLDK